MPFDMNAVNSSVLNYFHLNYATVASVVLTPEVQFDQQTAEEWVEFGVKSFLLPKHRRGGKKFYRVMATAQCWVKRSTTNLYRCQEIADSIVALQDHLRIDVQDFDVALSPIVGSVSFREAQIMDLTAIAEQSLPDTKQMIRVTVPGLAQEL